MDMGDAAAESFQGVPTLLKLLVRGRAFVGEEAAAESGEGEGVFQEDGEGGDGAADDQVVCLTVVRMAADRFGAAGENGHMGEGECLRGLLEEGGALLVGFDECVVSRGAGDGEDEAGEAGAGANVGEAFAGGDVADLKAYEGVEEVLDGDFGGVGDGGEGGGAVVFEEEVEVGAVGVEVGLGDGEAEFGGALKEGLLPVFGCGPVSHGR